MMATERLLIASWRTIEEWMSYRWTFLTSTAAPFHSSIAGVRSFLIIPPKAWKLVQQSERPRGLRVSHRSKLTRALTDAHCLPSWPRRGRGNSVLLRESRGKPLGGGCMGDAIPLHVRKKSR